MNENKRRVPPEDKHTRSSHALIDRNLLRNMQSDITHATELISSLRDEKDKLKKTVSQLQQENHEKSNIIRSLRSKVKYLESLEEDDEIIKQLNQADLKLKSEIELSLQGIKHNNSEFVTEVIALTEKFVGKVHEKTKLYQVFKSTMKSTNAFKQIIGNEDWAQSSILLLRFCNDLLAEDEGKHRITENTQLTDEESEQENYNKIIQDSKTLLDTLNYQKTKLESLNQEFSSRGSKMSPVNSPMYRLNPNGNLTFEKALSPEAKKEQVHVTNFHTMNKVLKTAPKYKSMTRK
jgi:hypothetical protein